MHKSVDENFIINQHLNNKGDLFPTHPFWKNFNILRGRSPDLHFDKPGEMLFTSGHLLLFLTIPIFLASSVHSYDARSLYPSAALKPNPVGN